MHRLPVLRMRSISSPFPRLQVVFVDVYNSGIVTETHDAATATRSLPRPRTLSTLPYIPSNTHRVYGIGSMLRRVAGMEQHSTDRYVGLASVEWVGGAWCFMLLRRADGAVALQLWALQTPQQVSATPQHVFPIKVHDDCFGDITQGGLPYASADPARVFGAIAASQVSRPSPGS